MNYFFGYSSTYFSMANEISFLHYITELIEFLKVDKRLITESKVHVIIHMTDKVFIAYTGSPEKRRTHMQSLEKELLLICEENNVPWTRTRTTGETQENTTADDSKWIWTN